MQENKFKVGQRYEVMANYEKGNSIEIVKIENCYATYKTIKNKNNVILGSNYFHINSPYAWGLRLIDEKESIHIYRQGNEVKAILKKGKEIVKKAVAKCFPDDEFVFETGAKLALNRLYEKPTLKKFEKGKRYRFSLETFKNRLGGDIPAWAIMADGCIVTPTSEYSGKMRPRGSTMLLNAGIEWCEEIEETTRTFNIGDTVVVTNFERTYNMYENWFEENEYSDLLNHFVYGSLPKNEMKLKVVGMGKHYLDDTMVYAVQNPETTQVFLINERGIELVD